MDLDTLRKDYDTQKSGGKGNMQFDAFKMDEEIDVVGLDSRQEINFFVHVNRDLRLKIELQIGHGRQLHDLARLGALPGRVLHPPVSP